MKEIYCDNSATTPVYPAVIDEMEKYFKDIWGNPSSIYTVGRIAKQAINNARERVAKILNCSPDEIYFTSGGSESDNLFIQENGFTTICTKKLLVEKFEKINSQIFRYFVKNNTFFNMRKNSQNNLKNIQYLW